MPNQYYQTILSKWSIGLRKLDDIATWMKADKPTDLPEVLQGVFFMDGNPLPDDCITMYDSPWDAQNLILSLQVFGTRKWTFHPNVSGLVILTLVRLSKLVYEICFDDASLQSAKITPIVFGVRIPAWLVNFTMEQTDAKNGDTWLRRSLWFGSMSLGGDYTLRKVVDKQGNYTPAFKDMLSKVFYIDCSVNNQNQMS